jgi:stage III sporulation protein AH
MRIKKETLVFLTSLAIIFIIGYVNMTMAPKEVFNEDEQIAYEDQANLTDTDFENLGDITDITDLSKGSDVAVINTESFNVSFDNFKISKEKNNMELIDHIEQNLSNSLISKETKEKFENILLNKNTYIEAEGNIELMLKSKGYNNTVVVVDESLVKVITNDTIEQADAVKILDVIVSETDYEPYQIKIVKFDNIEL